MTLIYIGVGILLGASLWMNVILFLIICGCYRDSEKLKAERDRARASLAVALESLDKRDAAANTTAKVVSIARQVH